MQNATPPPPIFHKFCHLEDLIPQIVSYNGLLFKENVGIRPGDMNFSPAIWDTTLQEAKVKIARLKAEYEKKMQDRNVSIDRTKHSEVCGHLCVHYISKYIHSTQLVSIYSMIGPEPVLYVYIYCCL